MSFKRTNAFPLLVPVPCFNGHVITAGKYYAKRWMYRKAAYVVWMGFKGNNFLVSIVIEDSELEIIGTRNEPVLAGDEAYTSYRYLRDLERLDESSSLVVVDVDSSIVETCEQPWLRWVEVDTLDTV